MARGIKISLYALSVAMLLVLPQGRLHAAQAYDVVVVGATPGGIAAAIAAARLGHPVVLVEYHRHVGGMSASGLGKSDITVHGAIQGIFREFVDRVYAHYLDTYGADSQQVKDCRNGYFYEPSVAEAIFETLLAQETNLRVFKNHRLDEAVRIGNRLVGIRATERTSGESVEFRAPVFIDATYEGDLAAYAGADYRLGREGRDVYNEAHAGVIYLDHTTRGFRPGSTGLGDDRLTAYTFRLCLSTNPDNQVSIGKPVDYDRNRYLGYFEDLRLGRLDTAAKALSIAPIPNNKTDVNMKPWPLGFPFAEENYGYVDTDWETRERITDKLRNITLGLVYFLQNDEELPPANREEARRYGMAKDEFTDNAHFPWQLYVREARRIVGGYTLTEHDMVLAPESGRAPVHSDAIATGEFPIDSFPTRKWEPGHTELEGYILMLSDLTKPYQIPYRTIVPEKVDGLLVPVALSASHVAFSSVRLEPTWMTIGQAAGVAAHLALTQRSELRNVRMATLQRMLLDQGQILTYFDDLARDDPAYAAMNFWGTKGFFTDYKARPREPVTRADAAHWFTTALATAGSQLSGEGLFPAGWTDVDASHPTFADVCALAAAGIFRHPAKGARFLPDDPFSANACEGWLTRASAVLSVAPPDDWRYDGADPSASIRRGELCRALYALIENLRV